MAPGGGFLVADSGPQDGLAVVARVTAAGSGIGHGWVGAWLVLSGLTAPFAAIAAPNPPAATPAASAPPAPVQHFDLLEIQVVGNTVLSEREIEAAVYPFLGPGKSAADVDRARAALEALYAAKGYPTVSAEIPLQHASSGVVVVRVVERPVGRVRVTGARYFDPQAVREGAPALAPGTVPNMPAVQQNIIALNQLPDRTVTPALRAGKTPDTVDVDLQVQDKPPLHASLELNNQQSQSTTPLRLQGTVSYDNLWQRGDSASLSFQVAPEHPADAQVISGSYLYHIPDSKLSLLASYVDSNSKVTTLGSTNVVGKGQIAGFRLVLPLGIGEGFVHSLSAGLDYKDLTENVGFGGATSATPVIYVPFTLSYQASWTGSEAQTDLLASLVAASRVVGSSVADYDARRYDARPDWAYLRADVSRTQNFPHDVQAWAHVTAQATPDPLVSSEQLSLGGVNTVRGYLESEALGDYGAALQAELRSPSIDQMIGGPVNSLRVHAFFDAGVASIHNPLPQQVNSYTLSSAGVGARIRVYDYLNGSLEDAVVLSPGPVTRSGTNRVLFRLYGDF